MKTRTKRPTTHLDRIRKNSQKYIQKKNDEYNAMSPIKRRVHTLKELVLMMETRQFVGGSGYGSLTEEGSYAEVSRGDLQNLLVRNTEIQCIGCAKAGIMFAKAVLGNDVEKRFYGSELSDANSVSHEILGPSLANLIESLYELPYDFDYRIRGNELSVLRQFKSKLPDRSTEPHERLLVLYKNIIKNRGHFVIDGFDSRSIEKYD